MLHTAPNRGGKRHVSGHFWGAEDPESSQARLCCAGQRQGSLWPAEGARPKAVKGWAPAQQAAGPKAAAVAGTQLGCGWRPVALLL